MIRSKSKTLSYYVFIWDINKNKLEKYDIIPYLKNEYIKEKKSTIKTWKKDNKTNEMPFNFDELKEFILNISKYQFWSRCEYELLIDGFPPFNHPQKIDVYYQIEINIDVIANIFLYNIKELV